MSKQNLEIVSRALEAWNRRDLDRALELTHPDVEVDWSQSRGPQSDIYRGRVRVRRFYEEWFELFDEVIIRPQDFKAVGEHVVVPNRGFARGREGVAVAASSTQVFTLHGGKIARGQLYQDEETALRAVGLAE